MQSLRSRPSWLSCVGMRVVLALGLSVGLGWLSGVEADDGNADVHVKVQLIADFSATREPDVLHGFVLGKASVKRGYVVEVTPLAPSEDGAHVEAFAQPEFDGSNWNDVVRVQLLAARAAVKANIRVYALVVKKNEVKPDDKGAEH
jgi:hypothetical protein